jgi:hypothetical protein
MDDSDEDPEMGLTQEQLRIAAAAIGITPDTFLAHLRHAPNEVHRDPEWPGNPAASDDERRAMGYGSIPIQDNRIVPDRKITPVQ